MQQAINGIVYTCYWSWRRRSGHSSSVAVGAAVVSAHNTRCNYAVSIGAAYCQIRVSPADPGSRPTALRCPVSWRQAADPRHAARRRLQPKIRRHLRRYAFWVRTMFQAGYGIESPDLPPCTGCQDRSRERTSRHRMVVRRPAGSWVGDLLGVLQGKHWCSARLPLLASLGERKRGGSAEALTVQAIHTTMLPHRRGLAACPSTACCPVPTAALAHPAALRHRHMLLGRPWLQLWRGPAGAVHGPQVSAEGLLRLLCCTCAWPWEGSPHLSWLLCMGLTGCELQEQELRPTSLCTLACYIALRRG